MIVTDNDPTSRQAIHDIIAAYAHGFDDRDLDLFLSIWWDDAEIVAAQPLGTVRGLTAIESLVKDSLWPTWRWSTHMMSNSTVRLDTEAPDCARSLSNVFCIGQDTSGIGQILAGTYRDVFSRRAGVWKLAQRTVDLRWAGHASAFAAAEGCAEPKPE